MAINEQLERIIKTLDEMANPPAPPTNWGLTIEDRTYTIAEKLQYMQEHGEISGDIPIHICGEGEYDPTTGEPTITDPEENTFYLVPTGSGDNDLFNEWIYIDGSWELFGSGTIDLDDYYTKTETDTALNGKLNANLGSANAGKVVYVDNLGNIGAAPADQIGIGIAVLGTTMSISTNSVDYSVSGTTLVFGS